MNLTVSHAYPKRPSEWTTIGADHYITHEPIHAGRLHREVGDALCKQRGKFWGLEPNKIGDGVDFGSVATCKRCLEIAARLSVAV